MQEPLNTAYTIAHSPDADDIFMYYALYYGWVSSKFPLQNKALDIESLNKQALQGSYDISAISFSVYPKICDEYALLRTGMSFGEGYGPKVVKLKGKSLKSNFKVALSGEHTTNAMIFRIKYPNARVVYKNFLDIEQSVLDGEVDCGILIHESILEFSSKLEVHEHIWDIWLSLAKKELPLPLGGMAIKRSIPLNKAIYLESTLTKAIKIALSFQDLLSKMLLEQKLVRVDEIKLKKYLSLYANSSSHTLSLIQEEALNRLYALGYDNGFYKDRIEVQRYLIPTEYNEYRF